MISAKSLCVVVGLIAVALYYCNGFDCHCLFELIRKIPVIGPFVIHNAKLLFHPNDSATSSTQSNVESGEKLFTIEELKDFAGKNGLHLAILGLVYDVANGERFYAKGKSYHGFTGRDASRSFITGDFTETGLRDDVLDLKPSELLSLEKWANTYAKDYIYKGKLIGRYYDDAGKPTDYHKKLQIALANARKLEKKADDMKNKYPPCDSEYLRGKGGKVYCTVTSGGIRRNWVGFPRQLFNPETGAVRCACVQESLLDNPNLSEYPGCPNKSTECKTSDS